MSHYEKCIPFQVLGLDCEWVSKGGRRCPVAMLQLATQDGHCALIRLYLMESIPQSLRDILEDKR